MPRVPRSGLVYPSGWSTISSGLADFQVKMREIEQKDSTGIRKAEVAWPIIQLHHQRTRWLYELYYAEHAIATELMLFCIREGYADRYLMAKWRRQGYEKLCCLKCIQTADTNFGTVCICRLPEQDKIIQCQHCGCTGCSSRSK
jgi:bud site selection protein 31